MITIPHNHKERSDSIYLMFKQNLLPPSLTGSVLSLPLVFEMRTTLADFKHNSIFVKYFDVISYRTATELIYSHSKTPGRVKVYPVLGRSSMGYISQFLQYSNCDISNYTQSQFSLDEEMPLPLIRISQLGSSLYSIDSHDFVNFTVYENTPKKFHAIPAVEQYSFAVHLKTQIHTRYYAPLTSHFEYPGLVMDSYLPFLAISNNSNRRKNYDGYTISPLTSDLLGIRQIPLRTILEKILNINLDTLSETIRQVKANKFTIIFAGTGGTGINTICWLSAICELLGFDDIFEEVHIFEKDKIDFSNIFRFPLPLSTYRTNTTESKKVDLIKDKVETLTSVTYYHDKFITSLDDIPSLLLDDSKLKPNHVIYGAPSVTNRNFLSSLGSFISATHANNTASLYINPIADDFLQVETYGLIQLNSFFMNQILMSIGFLDILASNSHTLENHHFSDYTFAENSKAGFTFNISPEMLAIPVGGFNDFAF